MGILYIVSTPIGNLQDIGIRTVKVLMETKTIACEDTRKTGFLLKKIEEFYKSLFRSSKAADKHLISYYEQNEERRIPEIISILKNGENIALVSDAGTPTISDPGFKLVRECIREKIIVTSIPGPSSVISSLVVSGFPTDKFLFAGYPPKKPGHRKDFYQKILKTQNFLKTTVILFEAPHKLVTTLGEIKDSFGNTPVVLTRELTKVHEEIRREKIGKSIAHFQKTKPKGEFVILFHPLYSLISAAGTVL